MSTPFIIVLVIMVLATIVAFDLRSNSQSSQLPNKYDAYMKVRRSLQSCKTTEQLNNACTMIDCFDLLYADAYLRQDLFDTLWDMRDKIDY